MIQKDSKIYIAGHTGLVGGAITRKLQALGYTNLILRDRSELDLLDQDKVMEFFVKEKPEYVIDAAARVGGIKANIASPTEFLYENLQIQNNIIWSAFKTDVKKFLFLGTSCIYPRESLQPMKEEYLLTGRLEPTNEGYAIAKIAGIKLCEYIYTQHGRKFISIMPPNLYGPNDNFDPENSHVLQGLLRRFHEAKIINAPEVVAWGTGVSRREFLYIDDLADAVVWTMNNYDEKSFLNIGSGSDVSIKELAELIKGVVGYEGKIVFDPSRPDGMPKKLLDVSRAKSLGWEARMNLKDGLEKTYHWYKENIK